MISSLPEHWVCKAIIAFDKRFLRITASSPNGAMILDEMIF